MSVSTELHLMLPSDFKFFSTCNFDIKEIWVPVTFENCLACSDSIALFEKSNICNFFKSEVEKNKMFDW